MEDSGTLGEVAFGVTVSVIGSLSIPVTEVKNPPPPAVTSYPNSIVEPFTEKSGLEAGLNIKASSGEIVSSQKSPKPRTRFSVSQVFGLALPVVVKSMYNLPFCSRSGW